jgi:hypothetical protein
MPVEHRAHRAAVSLAVGLAVASAAFRTAMYSKKASASSAVRTLIEVLRTNSTELFNGSPETIKSNYARRQSCTGRLMISPARDRAADRLENAVQLPHETFVQLHQTSGRQPPWRR